MTDSDPCTQTKFCLLRKLGFSDRDDVLRLLTSLPQHYPGSMCWLERTLDRCNDPSSIFYSAWAMGELNGVAICKLKSKRRAKICSFYVAPNTRGRRVGALLHKEVMSELMLREVDSVSVTFDAKNNQVAKFFSSRGFSCKAAIAGKYMSEETELVYIQNF